MDYFEIKRSVAEHFTHRPWAVSVEQREEIDRLADAVLKTAEESADAAPHGHENLALLRRELVPMPCALCTLPVSEFAATEAARILDREPLTCPVCGAPLVVREGFVAGERSWALDLGGPERRDRVLRALTAGDER